MDTKRKHVHVKRKQRRYTRTSVQSDAEIQIGKGTNLNQFLVRDRALRSGTFLLQLFIEYIWILPFLNVIRISNVFHAASQQVCR